MDARDWLATHWLAVLLAGDGLVFLLAILLWQPGTRALAMGLGVLALVPLLALVGVAFDGVSETDEHTDPRERWRNR